MKDFIIGLYRAWFPRKITNQKWQFAPSKPEQKTIGSVVAELLRDSHEYNELAYYLYMQNTCTKIYELKPSHELRMLFATARRAKCAPLWWLAEQYTKGNLVLKEEAKEPNG
jgi:hypothetical protein